MTHMTSSTVEPPQRLLVDKLLFDMDGTLLNSISAVEHAWGVWAEEEGVDMPDKVAFHGRTALDIVRSFVAEERVAEAAERIGVLESTSTQPIPVLPGTLELLASLPRDRWAIVTSAARPVAQARLAAAGIPEPAHLVTGSDVRSGKPDPEAFRLGRGDADTVIAFEDTVAGLRSARGAGCITVGVLGTEPAETLRAHADYLVPSLAAVTVESVSESGVALLIAALN